MAKKSKAPKNFYTASQAIEKLGMPRSTFFNFVKMGKIRKVTPEGYTEGYYPKSVIDKMALEKEIFSLLYASDTSVFRKAEEKDIQEIHNLSLSIFGTNVAPSYESRLAPFLKNPDIYYIVEQDGILVGYLGMVPIKKDAVDRIMGETEEARSFLLTSMSEIVTPENILMFQPGEAGNIYLIAVTRQGLSRSKYYGMKLISGGYEVLKDFARQGIIAKKLYAVSRTPDGVKLAKKLGFREIIIPENSVRRFELDLEKATFSPLHAYQQIVKETRDHPE